MDKKDAIRLLKNFKKNLYGLVLGSTIILLTGCREPLNKNREQPTIEDKEAQEIYDKASSLYNIVTLIYIEEKKAVLYEVYDNNELLNSSNLTRIKASLINGEVISFPSENIIICSSHEQAEQFVKNLLIEDKNIICADYPEHNSPKVKTLKP